MHPQRELTALAAGKVALRARIARRRQQCAEAAACVMQPLERIDRVLAGWRRLSPMVTLAAMALGLLLKRSPARQPRALGALLRWGPFVLEAVRHISRLGQAAPGSGRSQRTMLKVGR